MNIQYIFPVKNVIEFLQKVREHFIRKHIKDEFIECIVENCEYAAKSVSQLTMHIGVNHYELVKIRL